MSAAEHLLGALLCTLIVLAAGVSRLWSRGAPRSIDGQSGAGLSRVNPQAGFGALLEGAALSPADTIVALAVVPLALATAYCAPALWRADQSEHRLPNRWTHPLVLVTLLLGAVAANAGEARLLTGAVASAGTLGALHLLGGMGMGDVKLAVPLGALLGVQGVEAVVAAGLVAMFTASLVGLARLRREGARARIAFGPFLLAATGIVSVLTFPS